MNKDDNEKNNIPEALKNLGSKMHRILPNNQNSNENIDSEKEKSGADDLTEKVVEKGGSAAMQAYGVPKPIADAAAKKVAGPLVDKAKKAKEKIKKIRITLIVIGILLLLMTIIFI